MHLVIFVRPAETPRHGATWREINERLTQGPFPLEVWDVTAEELFDHLLEWVVKGDPERPLYFILTESEGDTARINRQLRGLKRPPLLFWLARTNILQVASSEAA